MIDYSKPPVLGPRRANEIPQDTHREHIAITKDWLLVFASVGVCALILALLAAFTATAGVSLWIVLPLVVAFGFAAAAALIALRSLEYARYSLHERFEQWVKNQETEREIAKIQATQITNVQVKGRQNVVSVNSAQRVEDVRLVPVHTAPVTRTIDGIPEIDLAFACDRFPIVGWAQRAWMGVQLPSGARIATFADYDKLLQPFVKAGLIVNRRERSAGQLVSSDPNELRQTLGLAVRSQDAQGAIDVTPKT